MSSAFYSKTPTLTLAALIEQVEAAPSFTPAERREIASAIRTVSRVLRAEPHLIPASIAELQRRIAAALPAAMGTSATRWRNAISLLRRALALIDPAALPARSSQVLAPGWKALLSLDEARPVRRGLARFSKWCSLKGNEPAEVTQQTFELFHDELAEHCLLRSPRETQQTAGHAWNKAVDTVPGWPHLRLAIASRRQNPSLPWSDLPPSLKQAVERYVDARAPTKEIRFDQDRIAFKATTVVTKRSMLRLFATAIVESGVPAASLTGLADLIALDNAAAGLTVLFERAGKQKTGRLHGMACLLLAVARHEVKASEEVVEGLADFCRSLTPRQSGMTQKNRRRLRQFDDPEALDRLLATPSRLIEAALRVKEPGKGEALLAQNAVAIELGINVPLRVGNIASLEIGRTLLLGEKSGTIIINRDEVKNDVDLEVPLPPSVVAMLRTYMRRFHPLLAPAGCMMLFPSLDGSHKRSVSLATQISRRIKRDCGLEFNVHLFRHLAARLYLQVFPGAYAVVMLLLGHKSLQTTMTAYCGTETDAAFRRFDEMIGTLRSAPGERPLPASPGRMDMAAIPPRPSGRRATPTGRRP